MRKLLSILFSITFLLSFSTINIYAMDELKLYEENKQTLIKKEMVDNTIEKIAEIKNLLLTETNSDIINKLNEQEKLLNTTLESLDVNLLNTEEVYELFSFNDSSKISKPSNSNTVTWYLSNYSYYDGTSYNIQELKAVGNNLGGNLTRLETDIIVRTNLNKTVDSIKELLVVYSGKIISSAIKQYAWLPYELLNFDDGTDKINQEEVSYSFVTTMSYIYVNKASEPLSSQKLGLTSQSIDLLVSDNIWGVSNGSNISELNKENIIIKSDNYSHIPTAITGYNIYHQKRDIGKFFITSIDEEIVESRSISFPDMPGFVY